MPAHRHRTGWPIAEPAQPGGGDGARQARRQVVGWVGGLIAGVALPSWARVSTPDKVCTVARPSRPPPVPALTSPVLSTFIERARSALAMPTVYWLGHGGWLTGEARQDQPGRPIELTRELARLQAARPRVHALYMAGLRESGLEMAKLPPLACDCSGFICWALGVPRDRSVLTLFGGWINTDSLHADALGPRHLFEPLERAVPGALLVYPKPNPGDAEGEPGHVAIVTEVDDAGRVISILHCAPCNLVLDPADGRPRNAIAITDTQLFDAQAATRIVMWKGFGR